MHYDHCACNLFLMMLSFSRRIQNFVEFLFKKHKFGMIFKFSVLCHLRKSFSTTRVHFRNPKVSVCACMCVFGIIVIYCGMLQSRKLVWETSKHNSHYLIKKHNFLMLLATLYIMHSDYIRCHKMIFVNVYILL